MNILKRIKDREKVPGFHCCPICNPFGRKSNSDMWFWHHDNCMSVVQQIFGRFETATAKDIAEDICRYELHAPNDEHSRRITKMNMECVHKMILKYGGSEKEWELVKAEVKKIIKSLASDSQVEKAIKDIKARLKGFTYKQKENIMYEAMK